MHVCDSSHRDSYVSIVKKEFCVLHTFDNKHHLHSPNVFVFGKKNPSSNASVLRVRRRKKGAYI
jgi:hypothetical protein